MEHKRITGGEHLLPFARSRIRALRATGMLYASQQFEIDGVSVRVRIEPGHEYITILGMPGRLWVLLTVDDTVPTTPRANPSIGGWSTTRTSVLLRITGGDIANAKTYRSNSEVGGQPPQTRIPENGWVSFGYSGGKADFSSHLNCVSSFLPYGGEAITIGTYDETSSSLHDYGYELYTDPTWGNQSLAISWYKLTTTRTRGGVIEYKGSKREFTHHVVQRSDYFVKDIGRDEYPPTKITIDKSIDGEVISYADIGDNSHLSGADNGDAICATNSYPEGVPGVDNAYMRKKAPKGDAEFSANPGLLGTTIPGWTYSDGPIVEFVAGAYPPVARARSRKEVGGFKQGKDFIQYPDGVVYSRTNERPTLPVQLAGIREFALTYDTCFSWGHLAPVNDEKYYDSALHNGGRIYDVSILKRTADGTRVLVHMDLRDAPGVKERPEILLALNSVSSTVMSGGVTGHAYWSPWSNEFSDSFVGASGSTSNFHMQIIPDQADTFTTDEWVMKRLRFKPKPKL